MDLNKICPQCEIKNSLAEITPEQIIEKARNLPFKEGITSSDEIFERRMNACRHCPACISQTTCIHSGAWCAFRARILQNTCPFPGGSRWN
ncbi:MAG: hypothetical protein J6O39_06125 [Treponema sp.]|nr:hypothetical protein [Treponema sp.]